MMHLGLRNPAFLHQNDAKASSPIPWPWLLQWCSPHPELMLFQLIEWRITCLPPAFADVAPGLIEATLLPTSVQILFRKRLST
mmetsp:Transcript_5895/g.8911  ORF Transcript_5895/g.8911 Transcript_5895/m.8911 type:complete len:83 (+) Transcript_5895:160-408(+)